ncbi:MAG: FmdB family zinc ribbon protein [Actinomycetota bacterium]
MPTYAYRCRDCGHSFDIVQKMSDASLTHCPECGGDLRKVFTAPAISFKGSGFYATDHGKKGNTGSGTDSTEKKDGKTPETKKPDTKKTENASSSDSSSNSSSSGTTKKEGSS